MYKHLECGCETHRTSFTLKDGYEWAETFSNTFGAATIYGYGLDGWDAGQWPYVVFAVSHVPVLIQPWAYHIRVEGDVTDYRYDHEECRDSALDQAVAWYWAGEDHEAGETAREYESRGGDGRPGVRPLPDRFRGRFSWARLKASQEKSVTFSTEEST